MMSETIDESVHINAAHLLAWAILLRAACVSRCAYGLGGIGEQVQHHLVKLNAIPSIIH